jgi:YD repeat-containing protein
MSIPNNYRKRTPATLSQVTQIVESSTSPQSASLTYTNGVLTGVTKGGVAKSLTYQDGKLIKVTSPTSIVNLSYDSAGNLASTTVTNA